MLDVIYLCELFISIDGKTQLSSVESEEAVALGESINIRGRASASAQAHTIKRECLRADLR